jgi:hypothetical protein
VYIKQQYPEANDFFREIRVIKKADEMYNAINQKLLTLS